MKAYVFVGPTLAQSEIRAIGDFICLPPVAQGDVYRVARTGACILGIIDGYFEGKIAVWHKEILWAMTRGVEVFGGASMGALRAAEMHSFGMRGVGKIFEDYRDGALQDDDEVAVLHGPTELGYPVLSEAMVNVRATLERASADGLIRNDTALTLAERAKALFYKERTWDTVLEGETISALPAEEIGALRAWLANGQVDLKAEDARAMLKAMAAWLEDPPPQKEVDFDFEWTDMWETAIAASRTVGLHRASDDDALPPDRLLDELRLDADAYRTAKTAALARLLGQRGAERQGLTVQRGDVRDALGRLRLSRGLHRRADLDAWLRANDLAADEFERLMEDEARLEAYLTLVEPGLDASLLDHLRLSDNYAHYADRARRKWTTLNAVGQLDPSPADVGLSPIQLVIWYFEDQLAEQIPDDLDAYVVSVGLAERSELYRLLAREYLFLYETKGSVIGV